MIVKCKQHGLVTEKNPRFVVTGSDSWPYRNESVPLCPICGSEGAEVQISKIIKKWLFRLLITMFVVFVLCGIGAGVITLVKFEQTREAREAKEVEMMKDKLPPMWHFIYTECRKTNVEHTRKRLLVEMTKDENHRPELIKHKLTQEQYQLFVDMFKTDFEKFDVRQYMFYFTDPSK